MTLSSTARGFDFDFRQWHRVPCCGSGMFSKENRRFTVLAITLFLVVIATMNGVGKAIAGEHAKDAWLIAGVSGTVILQLLSMLRQEQAREEARTTRSKIVETGTQIVEKVGQLEEKTDGNIASTIKAVAQEVKKAKAEPAPGQEQMPRTPEELQSLIKLFVHEMRKDVLAKTVQEITDETTKEVVLQTVEELKRVGIIK